MPVTRQELFGREDELALLDEAWNDPGSNVFVVTASGGVGKTALVNRWLSAMAKASYRGAARVLAWSFYSQGVSDRVGSADLFVETALRELGDPHPDQGSAWSRGERLARLVRAERTLLVLDGLEPLQHPPGAHEGRLKERAFGTLLVELAASNPGLCVVTTRLPVADLAPFVGSTVRQSDLDTLTPAAGTELLASLGAVALDRAELVAASRAFGGHALALTLLGNYLTDAFGGDARRWREVGQLLDEPRAGGHARRVMKAYANWFTGRPEISVLRLLGFFDRPADPESLRALRDAPRIPGLTEQLSDDSRAWNAALATLRRAALVAEPNPADPAVVDAHPLVREFFGEEVKSAFPDAWRIGHERLYEYLTTSTPEFPETLDEMIPLYAAVAHGREAGRGEESIREVYERRIQRGERFYAIISLGSVSLDLACLAGFFTLPWKKLQPGLPEDMQARLFNRAGFSLRAAGRLSEAIEATEAAAALRAERKEWRDATLNATNVAELNVLSGDLRRARVSAEQSIVYADQAADAFPIIVSRTTMGYVLHQLGRFDEALEVFTDAELREAARGHKFNILYSLRGYQYCDLLLDRCEITAACERARTMLGWAEERTNLLDMGLSHLCLARGALDRGDHVEGLAESRRALDLLQQADSLHHATRAYIVSAHANRAAGMLAEAEHFLTLARRHVERAGLRLHLVDCDLESAWICREKGDLDSARRFLASASKSIRIFRYGRRREERRRLESLLEPS